MEGHTWEGLILLDRESLDSEHGMVEYPKESVQGTFQTLITQTRLSFSPEQSHFESTSSEGEESVVSCILKNESEAEAGGNHGEDSRFEDISEGEDSVVHCDLRNETKDEDKERDPYSEDVDTLIEDVEDDNEPCAGVTEDTSSVSGAQRVHPKSRVTTRLALCRRCEEGPVCCVNLALGGDGNARPPVTASAGDEREAVRECAEGMYGEGGDVECAIDAYLIDGEFEAEGSVVSGEYELGYDGGGRERIEEVETELEDEEEIQESQGEDCSEDEDKAGREQIREVEKELEDEGEIQEGQKEDYSEVEDIGERERIQEVEKEKEEKEETLEQDQEEEEDYSEEDYSEEDYDCGMYNVQETPSFSWNPHEDDNNDDDEDSPAESGGTHSSYLHAPDPYYRCQEPLEVILEILGEEGDEEGRHRGMHDVKTTTHDSETHDRDSDNEETLCGSGEFSADSLEESPAPHAITTWSALAKSTSGTGVSQVCSAAETHDARALTRARRTGEESVATRRSKSKPTSSGVKGRAGSDRDKLRCLTSEIEEYLRETTLLLESATSNCSPRKRDTDRERTPLEYSIKGEKKTALEHAIERKAKTSLEYSIKGEKKTPLEYSIKGEKKTALEYAIERKAKTSLEYPIKREKETPLGYAINREEKTSLEYPIEREKKTPLENPMKGCPEVMNTAGIDTHDIQPLPCTTVTNTGSPSSSSPHATPKTVFPYQTVTRVTADAKNDLTASPLPPAATPGGAGTSLDILERLWAPITGPLNTTGSSEGMEGVTGDIPFDYPTFSSSSTPKGGYEDEGKEVNKAELERKLSLHESLQYSGRTSVYKSLMETRDRESEYFSELEASSDAVDALEWEESRRRTRGTSPVLYIPPQRADEDEFFFTSLENAGDNWLAMYDEPGECLESPSLAQLSNQEVQAKRCDGEANTIVLSSSTSSKRHVEAERGYETNTVLSSPSCVPPPPPPRCLPPSPPPPPRPPPPRSDSPPLTISCLASLEELCNAWAVHHDTSDRHRIDFQLQEAEKVAAESVSENFGEEKRVGRFEGSERSSQGLHSLANGVSSEEMHRSGLREHDELLSDIRAANVDVRHDITGISDRLQSQTTCERRGLEKENGTSHNIRENEKAPCYDGGTKQRSSQFRISARLEEIFREAERETCILASDDAIHSPPRPTVNRDDKHSAEQEDNELLTARQVEAVEIQKQLDEILSNMDAIYEEHSGARNTRGEELSHLETRAQEGGNSGGRALEKQILTQSSEKTAFQDILNISEDLKHICVFHVNKTSGGQYQPHHTTTMTPAAAATTTNTTSTTRLPAGRHTRDEVTTHTSHNITEVHGDARRNDDHENYDVPRTRDRPSICLQPEGEAAGCPLPDGGADGDSSRLVRFLQELHARNLQCYDMPLRYLKELLVYTPAGDADDASSARHNDSVKAGSSRRPAR